MNARRVAPALFALLSCSPSGLREPFAEQLVLSYYATNRGEHALRGYQSVHLDRTYPMDEAAPETLGVSGASVTLRVAGGAPARAVERGTGDYLAYLPLFAGDSVYLEAVTQEAETVRAATRVPDTFSLVLPTEMETVRLSDSLTVPVVWTLPADTMRTFRLLIYDPANVYDFRHWVNVVVPPGDTFAVVPFFDFVKLFDPPEGRYVFAIYARDWHSTLDGAVGEAYALFKYVRDVYLVP